jgi:C-methyltransferase C-terminal domain/Putative zinc binding domain/Methyltransferase domain
MRGDEMSYTLLAKCRICANSELKPVFDLGTQALANNFVKNGESRQGHYPLKVLFCPECSLSQLSVVVDPAVLYRDYKYVTSTSKTMKEHFRRLLDEFAKEQCGNRIVEIGSNDGAFLREASTEGWKTLGIDPACNLEMQGVETILSFFDTESAMQAKNHIGQPAIILARHCVAHMDDLIGFVSSLEILCGQETLIAIEIPYMRDTLARVEFDQIYHEHLSFISLHSLEHLLQGSPFHIHRVIHYAIHGGTVLIMLRRNDSRCEPTVSEYVREDKTTAGEWLGFTIKAHQKIEAMQTAVRSRVREGKTVCGFGASAKASVWIQACGFTNKEISFVTDNSLYKPGCLIPGTDIPVVTQDYLLGRQPDYACLWAWNFRDEILSTQTEWMDKGGRFLIPNSTGVDIVQTELV